MPFADSIDTQIARELKNSLEKFEITDSGH
jgi:hypothetical protein